MPCRCAQSAMSLSKWTVSREPKPPPLDQPWKINIRQQWKATAGGRKDLIPVISRVEQTGRAIWNGPAPAGQLEKQSRQSNGNQTVKDLSRVSTRARARIGRAAP